MHRVFTFGCSQHEGWEEWPTSKMNYLIEGLEMTYENVVVHDVNTSISSTPGMQGTVGTDVVTTLLISFGRHLEPDEDEDEPRQMATWQTLYHDALARR